MDSNVVPTGYKNYQFPSWEEYNKIIMEEVSKGMDTAMIPKLCNLYSKWVATLSDEDKRGYVSNENFIIMRDKENVPPLNGEWNHPVKFQLVPIDECSDGKDDDSSPNLVDSSVHRWGVRYVVPFSYSAKWRTCMKCFTPVGDDKCGVCGSKHILNYKCMFEPDPYKHGIYDEGAYDPLIVKNKIHAAATKISKWWKNYHDYNHRVLKIDNPFRIFSMFDVDDPRTLEEVQNKLESGEIRQWGWMRAHHLRSVYDNIKSKGARFGKDTSIQKANETARWKYGVPKKDELIKFFTCDNDFYTGTPRSYSKNSALIRYVLRDNGPEARDPWTLYMYPPALGNYKYSLQFTDDCYDHCGIFTNHVRELEYYESVWGAGNADQYKLDIFHGASLQQLLLAGYCDEETWLIEPFEAKSPYWVTDEFGYAIDNDRGKALAKRLYEKRFQCPIIFKRQWREEVVKEMERQLEAEGVNWVHNHYHPEGNSQMSRADIPTALDEHLQKEVFGNIRAGEHDAIVYLHILEARKDYYKLLMIAEQKADPKIQLDVEGPCPTRPVHEEALQEEEEKVQELVVDHCFIDDMDTSHENIAKVSNAEIEEHEAWRKTRYDEIEKQINTNNGFDDGDGRYDENDRPVLPHPQCQRFPNTKTTLKRERSPSISPEAFQPNKRQHVSSSMETNDGSGLDPDEMEENRQLKLEDLDNDIAMKNAEDHPVHMETMRLHQANLESVIIRGRKTGINFKISEAKYSKVDGKLVDKDGNEYDSRDEGNNEYDMKDNFMEEGEAEEYLPVTPPSSQDSGKDDKELSDYVTSESSNDAWERDNGITADIQGTRTSRRNRQRVNYAANEDYFDKIVRQEEELDEKEFQSAGRGSNVGVQMLETSDAKGNEQLDQPVAPSPLVRAVADETTKRFLDDSPMQFPFDGDDFTQTHVPVFNLNELRANTNVWGEKQYEVTVDGTTYTRCGRSLFEVSQEPLTLQPNDNWHGLTYWPAWKEKAPKRDQSNGRGSNTGTQMLETSDANGNEQINYEINAKKIIWRAWITHTTTCNVCFQRKLNCNFKKLHQCKHTFCNTCATTWRESTINNSCRTQCPTCRAPEVKQDDWHPPILIDVHVVDRADDTTMVFKHCLTGMPLKEVFDRYKAARNLSDVTFLHGGTDFFNSTYISPHIPLDQLGINLKDYWKHKEDGTGEYIRLPIHITAWAPLKDWNMNIDIDDEFIEADSGDEEDGIQAMLNGPSTYNALEFTSLLNQLEVQESIESKGRGSNRGVQMLETSDADGNEQIYWKEMMDEKKFKDMQMTSDKWFDHIPKVYPNVVLVMKNGRDPTKNWHDWQNYHIGFHKFIDDFECEEADQETLKRRLMTTVGNKLLKASQDQFVDSILVDDRRSDKQSPPAKRQRVSTPPPRLNTPPRATNEILFSDDSDSDDDECMRIPPSTIADVKADVKEKWHKIQHIAQDHYISTAGEHWPASYDYRFTTPQFDGRFLKEFKESDIHKKIMTIIQKYKREGRHAHFCSNAVHDYLIAVMKDLEKEYVELKQRISEYKKRPSSPKDDALLARKHAIKAVTPVLMKEPNNAPLFLKDLKHAFMRDPMTFCANLVVAREVEDLSDKNYLWWRTWVINKQVENDPQTPDSFKEDMKNAQNTKVLWELCRLVLPDTTLWYMPISFIKNCCFNKPALSSKVLSNKSPLLPYHDGQLPLIKSLIEHGGSSVVDESFIDALVTSAALNGPENMSNLFIYVFNTLDPTYFEEWWLRPDIKEGIHNEIDIFNYLMATYPPTPGHRLVRGNEKMIISLDINNKLKPSVQEVIPFHHSRWLNFMNWPVFWDDKEQVKHLRNALRDEIMLHGCEENAIKEFRENIMACRYKLTLDNVDDSHLVLDAEYKKYIDNKFTRYNEENVEHYIDVFRVIRHGVDITRCTKKQLIAIQMEVNEYYITFNWNLVKSEPLPPLSPLSTGRGSNRGVQMLETSDADGNEQIEMTIFLNYKKYRYNLIYKQYHRPTDIEQKSLCELEHSDDFQHWEKLVQVLQKRMSDKSKHDDLTFVGYIGGIFVYIKGLCKILNTLPQYKKLTNYEIKQIKYAVLTDKVNEIEIHTCKDYYPPYTLWEAQYTVEGNEDIMTETYTNMPASVAINFDDLGFDSRDTWTDDTAAKASEEYLAYQKTRKLYRKAYDNIEANSSETKLHDILEYVSDDDEVPNIVIDYKYAIDLDHKTEMEKLLKDNEYREELKQKMGKHVDANLQYWTFDEEVVLTLIFWEQVEIILEIVECAYDQKDNKLIKYNFDDSAGDEEMFNKVHTLHIRQILTGMLMQQVGFTKRDATEIANMHLHKNLNANLLSVPLNWIQLMHKFFYATRDGIHFHSGIFVDYLSDQTKALVLDKVSYAIDVDYSDDKCITALTIAADVFIKYMTKAHADDRNEADRIRKEKAKLIAEERRKKQLREELEAKKQKARKEAARRAEKARKWGEAFKDKIREHARETYVCTPNLNQEDVRAQLKQKELEEEWAQRKIEVETKIANVVRILSTNKKKKRKTNRA